MNSDPAKTIATRRSVRSDHDTWWFWERLDAWFATMSRWSPTALFGGFLVWFGGWTIIATYAARSIVYDDNNKAEMSEAAGRLIPAVGVLFAFLTAFVITNQWERGRAAEGTIGGESDACVRLALASGSPGVDGERFRSLLRAYMYSVLDTEWATLQGDQAGAENTAELLAKLGREVRSEATAPGMNVAISADLLAASEGLAVARRNRLNLSGHGLPAPLFVLVFLSGVVLCLNATALSVGFEKSVGLLLGGIVLLIALDLALIVAISDPFRGPTRVRAGPIRAVLGELERGRFGPVGDASDGDVTDDTISRGSVEDQ